MILKFDSWEAYDNLDGKDKRADAGARWLCFANSRVARK